MIDQAAQLSAVEANQETASAATLISLGEGSSEGAAAEEDS